MKLSDLIFEILKYTKSEDNGNNRKHVSDFLEHFSNMSLLKKSNLEITKELRDQIKNKLLSIHSWAQFCFDNNIKYHDLTNLKDGRTKYINSNVVSICNALNIEIFKYLKNE